MALRAVQVIKNEKPQWLVTINAGVLGKRRRVYGASEDLALTAAQEIVKEHRQHGGELSEITTQERAFILRWRGKLTAEEMEKALSAAAADRPGGVAKRSGMGVEKAVAAYIVSRAPTSGVRHMRNLRSILGSFAKAFEGRSLGSVKAGELDTFFSGHGASAANYYRPVRALFAYGCLHEWITVNPIARITPPKSGGGTKTVISVETMRALLRYAAGAPPWREPDPIVLRWLVAGGLCGLRHSEIAREDCGEIDVSWLGAAEMFVGKLKTAKKGMRERFIALEPAAAEWWIWAKLAGIWGAMPESGPLIAVADITWRRHRDAMCEAVMPGETWPHNALRRSFGSYHLAAFDNPALTASQMGHTSADTTFAKYRLARKRADGAAWFALTPQAVLGI